MKRFGRSLLFACIDVIALNLSLAMAYWIRFDFNLNQMPQVFLGSFALLAAVNTVTKVAIFSAFRLYKSLWRYAGEYEVFSVGIASACANALMTLLILVEYRVTGTLEAPRSLFAITMMLDIFAVGGTRLLYRMYRRYVMGTVVQLDQVRRVLIVGAGEGGATIAREMKHHPELNRRPVAFVDDDRNKHGHKLNGIPVAGGTERIPDVVVGKGVQEVIIAIPSAKPAELNRIYGLCAKTGCKVQILPSVAQMIDQSVMMQRIKNVDIEDLLGRAQVRMDTSEVEAFICGKTILVTGAGGSIGSELCRQIARFKPGRLHLLDNYENNLHDISMELLMRYPEVPTEAVVANIREEYRVREVVSAIRPQVIFHAAAHKHVPLMEHEPKEAVKNNIFGTWHVAHAAHACGVERFVLISTDKAVNPTNVMGASKRVAEMIVQALDKRSETEFVAVRFGNVLGSNGSVIPLFKKQIEAEGPVTITHPEVTRFFMTIPEAAQLVLQAGAMAHGGEVFLLDMGNPVKIKELAENMIRLSGYEPGVDIAIKEIGLRPGEKLYEELLLAEEGQLTTENNKIFIAKPYFSDYERLGLMMDEFRGLMETGSARDVKDLLKRMVPGYNEASGGA